MSSNIFAANVYYAGNVIVSQSLNVGSITSTVVASGQVQSLDSLRAHSLPSDAMIVASSTLVTPTNQNPGSYALVESANALTLTTTGSVPVVTQSPFADLYKEGSLYLNGVTGNYVSATATGLAGTQWNTTGLTVEAWVNYPTFTGAGAVSGSVSQPYLVGQFQPAGATNYWGFGSNTLGYVTFFYWNGASQNITSSVPLSTNTWNHIAFSCLPGGATATVYVNGTQVATTSISGTPVVSSSIPLTLGQFNSFSPNLNCYVADVRITTGAALYTGSSFSVPSAPISTSATGVCQALIRAGQNSPTIQNGALTFDRGLKQYMNFGPQTFNLATQGITIVWKGQFTGTAGNWERIFESSPTATNSGANYNFFLGRNSSSSTVMFRISKDASGTITDITSGTINQNTTYVITAVYNPNVGSGTLYLWVNGVPVTPVSSVSSLVGSDRTNGYNFIGASTFTGDKYLAASSNTFAIYNRALSNVEIYQGYLALNTVPATPLQKTLEIGDINGTPALSVAGNGQVSVQSIGLSSNVVPWPPAAMTGYDTVINGGVYKARASGELSSSYVAWYAFDKNSTGTFWISAASYGSTAPYASTAYTTTDVNGTSYLGEWLQIQVPNPVTLSSYSISPGNNAASGQAPAKWAILGSRDGVNWTLVDARAGITTWAATTAQTFSAASSQSSWTYFRCVVSQANGYVGATPVMVFGEWTLYGTADTSPSLTIAPATAFNTSVATPALTGVAAPGVYVPQDFSSSGLNIPAYVVSNTATVANTVAYSSFGPFAGEGSLYFPGGTGAYVSFPSSVPSLNYDIFTSDFTIEGWAYNAGRDGNQNTILSRTTPGNYGDWAIFQQGVSINFMINQAVTYINQGSGADAPANQWYHFAVTMASNTIRIFVNGVTGNPSGNAKPTTSYTSTGAVNVGWWTFVSTGKFVGNIANLRITRGAALYTTTFTPPTAPLQPIQGTTQAGLPYGTVLLLRNAPAPGRVLTQKFSGQNSSTVLPFPPAAMTNYLTTLNSGYGQGAYVASASSEYPTLVYPAWSAFDKSTSLSATGGIYSYWSTIAIYANGGGYLGSNVTVDVIGSSYVGEWLQLQMPVSVVLSNYIMAVRSDYVHQSPVKFWVLGSRDGINWTLVDSRSGVSWASTTKTFTVGATQAYTYYRFVTNTTTNATGNNPVSILELTLNGSIESVNVTADGRVGLGVVAPTRALEVAGDVVCGGTVSSGNPLMFRNRIINGDMRVFQRGTSQSLTGQTNTYVADRFGSNMVIFGSGTGGRTISQVTDVPLGSGLFYSSNVVYTATATSVSDAWLRQTLEAYQCFDLVKSPVTVSFWYKSNRTGTHGVRLFTSQGTLADSYQNITVFTANTWEFKTFVFGTTAGASLTGATPQNAGWSLDIGLVVSGQTGISIAVSDYFTLTGVQLEKGSVATPFETRPYATELQLCQRYYYQETMPNISLNYNIVCPMTILTSTTAIGILKYPVTMRSNAVTFTSSGTFTLDWYTVNANSIGALGMSPNGQGSSNYAQLYATSVGNGSVGSVTVGQVRFLAQNTAGGYLAISAEL